MREIAVYFLDIYERYCGRGKLFPLFLASLIILILIGTGSGRKTYPFLYILSVLTAIAHAFTSVAKRISSKSGKWLAALLIGVALVLSGSSVWSAAHLETPEKRHEREEDYREIFETILQKDAHAKVIASPDMMPYFGAYSADFDLLYSLPAPGETDLLPEEEHLRYDTFSDKHPDFTTVKRICREEEPFFAVVDKESMWPENIYGSGFDLMTTIGHYDIYICPGGAYE